MTIRKATKREINRNKQRQVYMRAAGYNVPDNGSWGPYQEKVWKELTTRDKEYNPHLDGLLSMVRDKITGNTTERFDPLDQEIIKTYNSENIDRSKTNRSNNKVVDAVAGTWMPVAVGAGIPSLVRTFVAAPIAAGVGILGGYAGGKAVDKASKAITGKDLSTNIAEHTSFTPGMAEVFNPGYSLGGGMAVKRLRSAIYNQITPLGYTAVKNFQPLSKKKEIALAARDFFTPKPIKTSVNNLPDWFKRAISTTEQPYQLVFRDDAWRKALRLKPRTQIVNGKPQSLYLQNDDGTWRYNLDYVKAVKNKYGMEFQPALYLSPENRHIAFDGITTNAGFLTTAYEEPLWSIRDKRLYSYPEVTITDRWDLHPFHDVYSPDRNLSSKFAKFARKHPDNPIVPVIRNLEALGAVGGDPFVLKQSFPERTIPLIIEPTLKLPK